MCDYFYHDRLQLHHRPVNNICKIDEILYSVSELTEGLFTTKESAVL